MITLFSQRRLNDCYVACCVMILWAYDKKISYDRVKFELFDNSLLSIKNLLNSYNVDTKIIKSSFNKDDFKLGVFAIKNTFGNHFIVIEKEDEKYYYYDPVLLKRHVINKSLEKRIIHVGLITNNHIINKKISKFQIHFLIRILLLLTSLIIIFIFIFINII